MRRNVDGLLRRVVAKVHQAPWLLAGYRGCMPFKARHSFAEYLARRRFKDITFSHGVDWRKSQAAPVHPLLSPRDGDKSDRGLNVLTYAYGQFGLAESARLYCRALQNAGWQLAVRDTGLKLPHEFNDRTLRPCLTDSSPFPVNIAFVNPDHLEEAIQNVGPSAWRGRYNVACWFWELEKFPVAWMHALERIDEIIVASHFVADAVRAVTTKPVTVIPIPLRDAPCSMRTRSDFGLGEEFTFLTTFDFNSSSARKNPLGVVEAFINAFPDRTNKVQLLLKSSNGHRHPEELQLLLDAASRDPRIRVRDEVLDIEDFNALMGCVDAYVSLHRSEGFGLAIAQAMWAGIPVVATAYSGNVDFMDKQTAYLVDYARVPVRSGQYIHWEGQCWADPKISDAADKMRRVYQQPEERQLITTAAKGRIRDACSAQSVGGALTRLLLASGRFSAQQKAAARKSEAK